MYDRIFSYIEDYLAANDGGLSKIDTFPFRKRSEHIWRVYTWACRLTNSFDPAVIDKNAVLTAALFHDAGYAISVNGKDHAENSAVIFEEYAKTQGCYSGTEIEFICFLIRNHSHKALMFEEGTPLELIIIMEADLLDETGALSIVWDCMMEGGQNEQGFEKTYNHINNYSGKILNSNPMYTEKAKEIWSEKQNLVREFIRQLSYDLGE